MTITLIEHLKRLAKENPPTPKSGVKMSKHVSNFISDRVTATVVIHQSLKRKTMRAYYLSQDGNEITGLFYTEGGNHHYFCFWDNEVSFFRGHRTKLRASRTDVPISETVTQHLRRDQKQTTETACGPIFLTASGEPQRLNAQGKALRWMRLNSGNKTAWVEVLSI